MDKTKAVVLFGGKSGEHDVSIRSACSVMQALDKAKYEIYSVGITWEGKWYWNVHPDEWLAGRDNPEVRDVILPHHRPVTIVVDPTDARFIGLDGALANGEGVCDVVLPILHGPQGEDGTIQGALELAGIPYVGSGVLGSALGMDKDRMKAVLAHAGLPVVPYIVATESLVRTRLDYVVKIANDTCGYPCFVKPANLGSSVGISRARNRRELVEAMTYALNFDCKIVIEQEVRGREIELSVLGDTDRAEASAVAGEIVPTKGFYDYQAKYLDDSARLIVPASLEADVLAYMQRCAVTTFEAVGASGLGRVDFFLTAQGQVYVNEINTMPGFTSISMYPKLWEASGVSYAALLDRLVAIALRRMKARKEKRLF